MKEGRRLQMWDQKAYTRSFRQQLDAEPRVLQKVCLKTRWGESKGQRHPLLHVKFNTISQKEEEGEEEEGREGKKKERKEEGRRDVLWVNAYITDRF